MKMPKEKPNARVRIPRGSKVKAKGYQDLGPDKAITVVLKGRLKGFQDGDEPWDPGKSFHMELSSVQITGPRTKVTLDDAMKKAERRV